MLINFSNHPSKDWNKKQLLTAKKLYKSILDIPFPEIKPDLTSDEIAVLANTFYKEIETHLKASSDSHNAVHIMGEFTLVYKLVTLLKQNNIKAVCSTSQRISIKIDNIKKISNFQFVQFREY